MVWLIIAVVVFGAIFLLNSNAKATPQTAVAAGPFDPSAPVVFYWRPGCPFCIRLEKGLNKAGIALDKRNIWEAAEHSATVRGYADGNETVPTVVVGSVAMVNPSIKQVRETVASQLGG